MKKFKNIFISLLAFAILCSVTSCKEEEWDSHYDATINRGTQESMLIHSLDTIFNGRYSSMAQWFKDAEMADLMNSGLQFTILAVPNHTFDSIFGGASYTADEKRNILMNAIFFKATVFQNDTGRLNLINERIRFIEGEDVNYLMNYHNDRVNLNPQYTNIAIYDGILHEVDKLFGLNEETKTYFAALDPLYSRLASYFSWDTLYYPNGTQQKLPSYIKIKDPADASKTIWMTSLAPVRQLYFDSLFVNADKLRDSTKIVAENMEFLMTNDVRTKLNSLYSILQGAEATKYFYGFDPVKTIESQASADSIIKFISKSETADSIKFLYYKNVKMTKEFSFLKSKVSTVKLTGGNKIYLVDSLLVNPKYLTLLDHYIVDTAMYNVISKFTITEEMETLFKAQPFNEARMFSMAPDPYQNYASFFASKLVKVENTSCVESLLTQKVLPKDSVHYFQFRFPREYFNTQNYKFTLIYAMKKNAPSFRLSLRSVNMQKDTTHIQYLYPLQKDGVTRLNSVPATITNTDSIRRLATEINFGTDYTGKLDAVTKDVNGNALKPASYNFYSVTFEPFQIFDYTEEVWLRFELGSVLVPMKDKTTTSGGKYIYINNFYFDKVEE